jgi:hypothetical protein
MIQRFVAAAGVAALAFAAGCGGSGGGVSTTSVNPVSPSYSSLQFAVGTANLYGDPVARLNVVSTFRQSNGNSATGVNTPYLQGSFTVKAAAAASFANATGSGFPDPYTTVFNGGPSARESGRSEIGGTPQTVAPGTPACDGPGPYPLNQGFVRCPNGLSPNTTTFGQSGGVFAMGIAPYNAVAETGQAYSYQPYPQPFYSDDATTPDKISQFQFVPWGGPPAFDPFQDGLGTRDGTNGINGVDSFGDPYFLGIGEGITVFDGVKVRSGTYMLRVAVATVGSGGGVTTSTVTKSAHLNAASMLPTVFAPAFVPDGKGGGTLNTALPHGVTEAYLQIVDWGPGGGPNDGAVSTPSNCQGPRGTSFAPVYYTIHVANAARATYRLPDMIGPNLATSGGRSNIKPSPSVCTAAQNTASAGTTTKGDDIVVQMIGFDYPIFAAAHSLIEATTPQNPHITNGAGQANITISQFMEQDNGSARQAPLLVRHRPHVTFARRTLR